MDTLPAEISEAIRALKIELRNAVKASSGLLIFQDTREHLDLVVYDYIIRNSRRLRMIVDCLNGSVLKPNQYGVLELLSARLNNGVRIEMIVRNQKGCDPEIVQEIRALATSHRAGLSVCIASEDLLNATRTTNETGFETGFFTFTVGDEDKYRQEFYKGENPEKPFEAYNGINDGAHAKELKELFDAHIGGCQPL